MIIWCDFMFNLELINDEIDNFNVFENIEINFSDSIKYNSEISSDIKYAYHRSLNDRGKFLIDCFHLNLFNNVEKITHNIGDSSDFLEDMSDFISQFFAQINKKLNLKNIHDLDKLIYILKISSIILDNALEDNDMDMIYESFYQMEGRIKKEGLISEFSDNLNRDEVIIEMNCTFKDSSIKLFSRQITLNNFEGV